MRLYFTGNRSGHLPAISHCLLNYTVKLWLVNRIGNVQRNISRTRDKSRFVCGCEQFRNPFRLMHILVSLGNIQEKFKAISISSIYIACCRRL